MAIEFRLILAGDVSTDEIGARAFPDPADRATFRPYGRVVGADLHDRYGFSATLSAGRNGYVDAAGDDGQWEWEPDQYARVDLRLDNHHPTANATVPG